MVIGKILKNLLQLGIIFAIGNASCNAKINYQDDNLPELAYTDELQEAIDQVLLAYPDYQLGISAAVLIPGYRIWRGVSGFSHQDEPLLFAQEMNSIWHDHIHSHMQDKRFWGF